MNMKTITYDNIRHLLNDWQPGPYFPFEEEIIFLDEFLKERGYTIEVSPLDLGKLYNEFSEECWAASWEDNAEGQFIEWLNENMK